MSRNIYTSSLLKKKKKIIPFDVQEIDAKGNPHGNSYKDSYKMNKKVEVKFSDYFRYDPSVRVENFE